MSETSTRPPSWSDHKSRHPKRLSRYLFSVEWGTEWLVYRLKSWAFVDLLSLVGSFALITTLVGYCRGADDRAQAQLDARKARQYQAWQVITNAQGKPGNGGRTQALEDLAWDSVDLSGVDLSRAWLQGLSLPGATLAGLKADSANLSYADLRGANLFNANLSGANLQGADLRGANLEFARLDRSVLVSACLNGADLWRATLDSANLLTASMRRITAFEATFRGAILPESGRLDSADFTGAVFDSAEFADSVPRTALVTNARFKGAHLPLGIPLGQDRDLITRGALTDSGGSGGSSIAQFRRYHSIDVRGRNLDSVFPREEGGAVFCLHNVN